MCCTSSESLGELYSRVVQDVPDTLRRHAVNASIGSLGRRRLRSELPERFDVDHDNTCKTKNSEQSRAEQSRAEQKRAIGRKKIRLRACTSQARSQMPHSTCHPSYIMASSTVQPRTPPPHTAPTYIHSTLHTRLDDGRICACKARGRGLVEQLRGANRGWGSQSQER